MKTPEVIFTYWIEPDDSDPRRELSFEQTGVDHSDWVQWIDDQIGAGNVAAWCGAVVTASVEIIQDEKELENGGQIIVGNNSLWGMSYPSQHRLWVDNLEDLKSEALSALFDRMREVAKTYSKRPHGVKEGQNILVVLDQLLEKYS